MGVFKRIKEATITGGNGNFFGPGNFQVKVLEVKSFESQGAEGTNYFLVECQVLGCDEGARLAPPPKSAPGTLGPLCKRGDKVSWLVNLSTKYPKVALGNVKQLITAADPDIDEEDIDEDFCEEVVGPGQPFRGLCMKIRAWNKPTKETGDDFTHLWWEYDPTPPADTGAEAA